MFYKSRVEPNELKILRCLNNRMELPAKVKSYYQNLEKGYEGEKYFDQFLESVSSKYLIINDLLLEHHHSIFQIDTLIISQEKALVFEVKNYQGDFYIEKDIWYGISGNEIKNPMLQLNRSQSLLRQVFQELKINLSIETYIVFVNPEFTLYKAPLNLPIIFPTQLNQFINKLNITKTNQSNKQIAEKLVRAHSNEQPFTRLPKYDFDSLRKGIACEGCGSLLTLPRGVWIICEECGAKEKIEAAIMRQVELFQLLFPDKNITTRNICVWCNNVNIRKIREVLKKNITLIGRSHSAYYLADE